MICNNIECDKEVKRKFCSKKCADKYYYLTNKEQVVNRIKKWRLNNPEKIKELARVNNKKYYTANKEKHKKNMLKNYHENKERWNSRSSVYNVVTGGGGYVAYPIPKITCKVCGSIGKLRIHCEGVYRRKKQIIEAIDKGEIYYLCPSH